MGTTVEKWGEEFDVEHVEDHDASPPWLNGEGHCVVVSEHSRSEFVNNLIPIGGGWVVDYTASLRVAKAENWGHPKGADYAKKHKLSKTACANAAVMDEVARFKAY